MICRAALHLSVILLMATQLALPARGGDPETADTALRFRRVLAPENRMQDWPLGGVKYLPLDSKTFERLLAAAQSQHSGPNSLPLANTTAARYEAKLEGDQLVDGRASLDVVLRGAAPSLVPLDPCNLALEKAWWAAADRAADQPGAAALLGLGGDGKTSAWVERSGQLRLAWSLAGRRDSSGSLVFVLEAPRAAMNQLTLELPEGIAPKTDVGLVGKGELSGEKTRRWRIDFGGRSRLNLRLPPAGASDAGRLPTLLQESCVYDMSVRGMDVTAQWKMQVPNEPLQQVVVLLDPGLQLVSAQCGDAPASWSVAPAADGRPTRVVLSWPEPLRDTERVLRLGAVASPVLDRPWRLPRMRAEGLSWQEGELSLLTTDPLTANRLRPIGCAQSDTEPLAAPRAGMSTTFQCFRPDATVEVALARRKTVVQWRAATDLALGPEEIAARVTNEFRVTDGVQSQLRAVVGRDWIVDAVESLPAAEIADWTIEREWEGADMLNVRLAKVLSPTRPVRLIVSARQVHAPAAQTFPLDRLLPVRFLGVSRGKHLVSLRADGPYEVRLSNAEQLKFVDPQKISADQADLFAAQPQGLLFEDAAFSENLTVSLLPRKPKYSAAIRTEAVAGAQTIREDYVFRCVPEGDRVDRVFVRFYPRRDVPPRWTLRGEDDQPLPARLLSNEEQEAAGLAVSAEVWEIPLRRPRIAPFEMTATRETSYAKQQPLSLAALPEAGSQRGTLVIRALGPKVLQIENRRLEPIPPESLTPNRVLQTIQGTYQYDPLQDTASGPEPAICVTAVEKPAIPEAWIWTCRLESRYETGGTVRHRANCELQNLGGRRFAIWLPAATRLDGVRGVWIDGDEAVWSQTSRDDGTGIVVNLPADRRFPTVAVEWTASESSLGTYGPLEPPRLEASLPVLASDWTVWLPSDYDIFASTDARQRPRGAPWTVSQRLFGWFGRGKSALPFNPFSPKDWAEPLAGFTPQAIAMNPAGNGSGGAEVLPRQEGGAPSPWQPANDDAAEVHGWTTYRAELSASPPALRYVHRDSMRLLAMVVLLAAVGVGHWIIVKRPRLLIGLLGALAAAALTAPRLWAPLASAALVGLLFCLAARWIRWRRPEAVEPVSDRKTPLPEKPASSGGAASGIATVGAILLALGSLLPTGAPARADALAAASAAAPASVATAASAATTGAPNASTAATPADAAASEYPVFVPIDAQRKPTGGKVYLPEPFYQELHRRARAASGPSQAWLIRSATYRGVLAREGVSGRLVTESLKAQYDLYVFSPATQVRIPIRADGVSLLPGGAALDGRVVPAKWNQDGTALLVDVGEAGACRLELALQPSTRAGGGPAGFDFGIPRVAASRLELSLPDGAPAIEVPAARGGVRRSESPPRLAAALGPADRLSVRWRESGAAGAAVAAAEVEQLMWLKVLPGSVVIDAKLKLRPLSGQVQQLQLLVDRRLRLLPLGNDSPTVAVQQGAGRTKLITLRWPKPLSEETTLAVTFLLTETSGVGNFRLPQLDVADPRTLSEDVSPGAARPSAGTPAFAQPLPDQRSGVALNIGKRWLAISVDASLEGEEHCSHGLEGPLVSDFLKAWGASDARPQSAYRLTAADNDWRLSTRPHEASTSANQSLALCFDRHDVELAFDAELTTTAGYLFQYRVAGPAGWKLERVSLLEQDVERAGRWSQDPDGTITLFLTGSVSGRQKLSLYGRLPMRTHKNWPLPEVRIQQCQIRSATVELFRRPVVQVTWQSGQRAVTSPSSADAARADFGRFLAAFRLSDSRPAQIAVTVLPNKPQVRVSQLLTLRGSGLAWTAHLDCSVDVAGGGVDRLCLRAPSPWNGPYAVSSPGKLDVLEIAGEGRQLVFQPQSPITQHLQFGISGPLTLAREDRPNAPDAAVRYVDALQRWVALPERSQGQSLIWQTRGLRRCGQSQRPSLPVDANASLYTVVGPAMQAVLQSSTPPRNATLVRLADISLAWLTDGTCQGIALFDLEPGGATECPLHLPEGLELVQVLIDGSPAAARAVRGAWRIPLGSKRLPQRAEVVFRGRVAPPDRDGRQVLVAPAFGDLHVQQTLWTIAAPASFAPAAAQPGETVDASQQQWLRLKNVASLVQSAVAASANDPDETLRWYPLWIRRLQAARAAVQRGLAHGDACELADAIRAECEAIDREQAQLAEKLDVSPTYKQLSAAAPATDGPLALWTHAIDAMATPTRLAVDGGGGAITLQYRRVGEDGLLGRLMAAAAVLALAAAIGWKRGAVARFLHRWPHAAVSAVGIAWWLWLWPSLLGLLILLGGLLAAARRLISPGR